MATEAERCFSRDNDGATGVGGRSIVASKNCGSKATRLQIWNLTMVYFVC